MSTAGRALRVDAAVLALASAAVAGCALHAQRPAGQLSETSFRRLFEATVSLQVPLRDGRTRLGSGFVATDDGWIVTSHHVVADRARDPVISYSGGTEVRVEKVYAWAGRDLAVVVPRDPPQSPFLLLGDSASLAPGQAVFACGVPFGLGRTVTRGLVDRRSVLKSPRYLVTEGIIAEGPSYPGDSGGPVINADGEVIGIHLGSVSSQSRALVPSNLVRSALVEARVLAELARQRSRERRAELTGRAR